MPNTTNIAPGHQITLGEEEIADVLLYLIQIAQTLKVDVNAAVTRKMAMNALKYPPIEK